MRLLIAGAGIGGLTLALSLRERGIRYTVFDAMHEVRELMQCRSRISAPSPSLLHEYQ
jgi:2-polyprenyl-6-methoxyphenol hydroxylase-like FAD-dependent oxidoreductase